MKHTARNPFISLGLGAVGISASLQASTLLQFGGTSSIGPNDRNTEESYGDNVTGSDSITGIVASAGVDGFTGTPNIGLTYNPNAGGDNSVFDSYPDWNGRGHVLQTQFVGSNPLDLEFTPAVNMGALITSFELDEWTGGGNAIINWAVKNGETVIVSGSADFTAINGGRIVVNTGMTAAQARANAGATIKLELTMSGGISSYYALDNLVFDQVVNNETSITAFTSEIPVIDGSPFSLNWEIANAAGAITLTLYNGTDTINVLPSTDTNSGLGSYEVNPTANTTYTLTLNGSLNKQVSVLAGRALSLTSSSLIAPSPGNQVTLNWVVQAPDGTPVTISDGINVHDVTSETFGGTGSMAFNVPSDPTTFTLESNNSGVTRTVTVRREQTSTADFSVTPPSIVAGSPVTVTWANAAGGPTDWIGVYPLGEIPDGDPVSTQWNYLNGTRTSGGSNPSGTMTFNGLVAGDYYVWMLLNDTYTIARGPVRFSVVNPPPAPTIIRVIDAKRVGDQFTLEWQSQAGLVYDIYASTDLQGDPLVTWTKIADDHPAEEDGSTSYTEDLGATPPAKRFYKVYEYPAP